MFARCSLNNPTSSDTLVRMEYQSDQALEELQSFVAVVEARGFTSAMRKTGARKATLSKRIASLEERLGVKLLVRTTRTVQLTDEGRAYFEHAQRALSAVRDAESLVTSARAEPRGTLRVTTFSSMAARMLDHIVPGYLEAHPKVRVEISVSERRADLVREGIDLAVWTGVFPDSSLIVRRLGRIGGGYYASPKYLANRPRLRSPDQLAHHETIGVPKGELSMQWGFVVSGKNRTVPLSPRLVVSDNALATRAAVNGIGVVRSTDVLVAHYLQTKELVQVLQSTTPPGIDVFAVFPPGGALVPRTRVFLDALVSWFK